MNEESYTTPGAPSPVQRITSPLPEVPISSRPPLTARHRACRSGIAATVSSPLGPRRMSRPGLPAAATRAPLYQARSQRLPSGSAATCPRSLPFGARSSSAGAAVAAHKVPDGSRSSAVTWSALTSPTSSFLPSRTR
ncbi:MAG: hypothetical protein B7Z61_06395 [Acidobacteria bacterium 37-71-11]|nr:MAG: hypothetical protein B7Z61_06395 [Acidobacteria bacterium 37-71-11]